MTPQPKSASLCHFEPSQSWVRPLPVLAVFARRNLSFLSFLLLTLAFSPSASTQTLPATGTPPFGSFGGGPDVINLANLNAHWNIPVLNKPGRGGMNFTYNLSYDTSVWAPVSASGVYAWTPAYNWGWIAQTATNTGYISYTRFIFTCPDGIKPPFPQYVKFWGFVYHDAWGGAHPFGGGMEYDPTDCDSGTTSSMSSLASDSSGYVLHATISNAPNVNSATITTSSGQVTSPPQNNAAGSATATDRNGNEITSDGSGHFYDTLSSTLAVLTYAGSGTPSSPTTFTYTAPSGGSATYTMKYTAYTVQTSFSCSGISEYGPTSNNLVSEIDLPDWNATTNPNAKYTFMYEATPGHSGNVTGRIASVILPTGGTISYTYTGGSNGITCADGSTATLNRTTPDSTTAWTYAHSESGTAWTTLVTDPEGNQTNLNFQSIYETERDVYQGSSSSGTLLRTNYTCYNGSTAPCNTTAVTMPITKRAVTQKLPVSSTANIQSQSVVTYDSIGLPTESDVYAFGSGTVGSLAQKTLITYASLGNITAFQQSVAVQNGAGTTLSLTNYNYDQTTPVAAPSNTPQLTNVTTSRGNLTSVQRCTDLTSCSTYLTTTMTYDTAGQLQTSKDNAGNQTSFSYTDNFFTDNGSNPASTYTSSVPTDAFPTTITPPTSGTLKFGYYYYSGQLAQSTDQNNNVSYNHYQDLFARPTSSYGPPVPVPGTMTSASPWVLNVYAASHTQADTYTGIDDTSYSSSCGSCRHDQVLIDGLGRALHSYLVSDPEGETKTDSVYDPLGRIQSTSHPYRTASDSTYGIETPSYDALSRTIKITHQDGTYSQSAFGAAVSGTGVNTSQLCSSTTYGLAYPALFTDEAGKKREVWTDALGRTIESDEPDSSSNLTSNTCYTYDALGNLLTIVHGTQTRTYVYDALSRVTSVTIPELANSSGTNCAVTFSYDNNSNLYQRVAPAPNQTSCTTTVTTTYSYDALNRRTKVSYSTTTPVVTPTVQYGYDGNTLTGCTTTPPSLTDSNPKGLMTSMCDGSGATSWAHDAAGRTITEKRTIVGSTSVTQTLSYTYNLDGSGATVTYPSGKTITYTVSNVQRLTAANDVANSVQFTTAASYAAPGGLSGMITGQVSGGFSGITESHSYNNSLEYTTTKAQPPTGPAALDLSLSHSLTGGDNGTVTAITNNADTGRTQTLTYDPLNRILAAQSSATSGTDCWGQVFGPDGSAADDALGNLTKINAGTQTQPTCPTGTLNNISVDANNHLTGTNLAYDASGNMTQDGKGAGYSYVFDAENRLVQATGMTNGPYCYVYDGLGLRVAKEYGASSSCTTGTFTKLYWRSLSGDSLAETDGSGSTTTAPYTEYIFFAGRRVASRVGPSNGNSSIFYYFTDQLGSTRTITTGSGPGQTPGQLCYDADFAPYGQEISYTARLQTTACPPTYKFTGYERDPETAGTSDTGLDYAFARLYSSRLGRFLSTDPLGGSIGNLQSHNVYAYALNVPTSFTDPTGLATCNLNIFLANMANLNQNQLTQIKNQIENIFGQTDDGNNNWLNVQFVNNSNSADATLTLATSGLAAGLTLCGPSGYCISDPGINVNKIPGLPGGDQGTNFSWNLALGSAAAHEFGHWLGLSNGVFAHEPQRTNNQPNHNLMMSDQGSGGGYPPSNRDANNKLTSAQIATALKKCYRLRQAELAGAAVGGAAGGAWEFSIDYLDYLFIPSGGASVTTIPSPIVTVVKTDKDQ